LWLLLIWFQRGLPLLDHPAVRRWPFAVGAAAFPGHLQLHHQRRQVTQVLALMAIPQAERLQPAEDINGRQPDVQVGVDFKIFVKGI